MGKPHSLFFLTFVADAKRGAKGGIRKLACVAGGIICVKFEYPVPGSQIIGTTLNLGRERESKMDLGKRWRWPPCLSPVPTRFSRSFSHFALSNISEPGASLVWAAELRQNLTFARAQTIPPAAQAIRKRERERRTGG